MGSESVAFNFWSDGLQYPGGGYPLHTRLHLTLDVDRPEAYSLFDASTGETAPLSLSFDGSSVWTLAPLFESDFVPLPQAPARSLLIPSSRVDHGLILSQPGGVSTSVSIGGGPEYYDGEMVTVYEGRASFNPAQPFWIVDLTTRERTQEGATNLVTATWTADYTLYPLVNVLIDLDGREYEHYFTVRTPIPGGPEMLSSGYAYGVGGGLCRVSASVGEGMEFLGHAGRGRCLNPRRRG